MANRMLTLGIPSGLGVKPNRISGLQAWYDASRLQIGAAQFNDANSEYLSVADHADLSMGDIDFTLAGWVYMDSVPGAAVDYGLWGKWSYTDPDTGTTEYSVGIGDGVSGRAYFSVRGATVLTTVQGATGGTLAAGRWYFIVARHDATNNRIEISVNDGAFDTAAHSDGCRDGTSAFYIGAYQAAPQWWGLNGRAAKVAVWKKLLSAAEVTSLYNNGAGLHHSQLSGSLLTSLISYWNLNENGGQRNDSTANAHHLTDNNTVSCAPSMTPETPADATLAYIWEDLSGNGRHVTQATEASKPLYKVSIVNGRPVVRFDGSNDFLNLTSALSGNLVTVFAVAKNNDAVNASVVLGQATLARPYFEIAPTSVIYDPDSVPFASKSHALDGQFLIASAVSDGTNITAYVNGVAGTPVANVSNFSVNAIGNYNNAGYLMDGDIAEIIVYNRALGAGEHSRVVRYLGRRYGIAIS